MEVRRAGRDEASLIAGLNQHVHVLHAEAEPDHFYATTPDEAVPFFASILADASHVVFIAQVDDEPAGYVWAEDTERPDNPFTKPARTLYIHHIAVDPRVRRQGTGRALFTAVEQEARRRGITRLGLDHWTFNETAARFFDGLGFEPYNVRMRRHVDDTGHDASG